ncbi:MAG: glycine cleavage system protein GcvH [Candidatus Eisenbacteria bacterium]|nr:glycine cleavage system protein GcvH [Candidatus Eisenbacteria bacterium]
MAAGELRFTKTHEWLLVQGGSVTLGLTDYAQHELGDIVFVELPAVGKAVQAGDVVATVESVKSVSEIYAPVSGSIAEVNGALDGSPGLINSDPMGEGWILRIALSDAGQTAGLLTRDAYDKEIGA